MAVLKRNLIGITLVFVILWVIAADALSAGEYRLQSPDKRLTLQLTTTDKIYYSVFYDSKPIIKPSPISLTLYPGTVLGKENRKKR